MRWEMRRIALLRTGDIGAGGGDSRPGVFDQRTDDDIRPPFRGLPGFAEFPIAVIHDNDIDLRNFFLNAPDYLRDFIDADSRAQFISPER